MTNFIRRNDYLTTAQASKFLNVTRFTVLNWIKEGKLQSASTLGGHQRIPRGVVLSARRQIKETNHLKPQPKETNAVVPCWDSEEIIGSKCGHNCNKCLVFKKKLNLCFLAVREYGSLKLECKHDCLNCAYLAKYYPDEKKNMEHLRLKAASEPQANGEQESSVRGVLKKVFYNSGRLIASIERLSKGPAKTKHSKRMYKKTMKG